MSTNKHLSLSERIQIQHLLEKTASFKEIGRQLNKDCTTISKEIRNHLTFKNIGCFGNNFNNCLNRFNCTQRHICEVCTERNKLCKQCLKCSSICSYYKKEECPLLLLPPYVCNGCKTKNRCTLTKKIYSAVYSQEEYKATLSEARSGFALSQVEVTVLDSTISPLIQKGQSVHHICVNNMDKIMFSEKSIYNYIDAGILTAKNLDLPRKVRYHARKSRHDSFKVDKRCRIGRTYIDFNEYITSNPDTPIVELDSVEGVKGGKVLLTIHFVESEFMLAYLRNTNDSQSVIDIFEKLYWELNPENFIKLFRLCLTDNGSEFSNPLAIEFDKAGNRRTQLFYCDPSAPQQKGAAENNHELIRRILPKGTSFNNLTQDKVERIMNHINSYGRKKIGDLAPYELFRTIYGKDILEKLGSTLITPNDITLNPDLLK